MNLIQIQNLTKLTSKNFITDKTITKTSLLLTQYYNSEYRVVILVNRFVFRSLQVLTTYEEIFTDNKSCDNSYQNG